LTWLLSYFAVYSYLVVLAYISSKIKKKISEQSCAACSVVLEPAGLDQLLATSELKPTSELTSHNQPNSN
jgi:hypothetical protein